MEGQEEPETRVQCRDSDREKAGEEGVSGKADWGGCAPPEKVEAKPYSANGMPFGTEPACKRDRETERNKERDRQRQRQTETERQTENGERRTERQTQRQKRRDRDVC